MGQSKATGMAYATEIKITWIDGTVQTWHGADFKVGPYKTKRFTSWINVVLPFTNLDLPNNPRPPVRSLADVGLGLIAPGTPPSSSPHSVQPPVSPGGILDPSPVQAGPVQGPIPSPPVKG